MNRLTNEQEERIMRLIAAGLGLREIARVTGHSKWAIQKRIHSVKNPMPEVKPRPKVGPTQCDHCGSEIVGAREFYRRTRRAKHKFCNHYCYGAYYRKLRENEACKRCGVKRKEFIAAMFCKGYCQRCYEILRKFNYDEALASAHDLTRQLKKEINNVSRNQQNQEHVRPAQDAHRND